MRTILALFLGLAISSECFPSTAEQGLQDYIEATKSLQNQEFERAISISAKILTEHPNFLEAERIIGTAKFGENNFPEASIHLRRYLQGITGPGNDWTCSSVTLLIASYNKTENWSGLTAIENLAVKDDCASRGDRMRRLEADLQVAQNESSSRAIRKDFLEKAKQLTACNSGPVSKVWLANACGRIQILEVELDKLEGEAAIAALIEAGKYFTAEELINKSAIVYLNHAVTMHLIARRYQGLYWGSFVGKTEKLRRTEFAKSAQEYFKISRNLVDMAKVASDYEKFRMRKRADIDDIASSSEQFLNNNNVKKTLGLN